jgi:hypothetical protein
MIWVDPYVTRERMRDMERDADRRRLVELAGAGRPATRRTLAAYGWRLRQAAGFGLLRTGMWLLDPGRV